MEKVFDNFYKVQNDRAVFKLNCEIYSREVILQAAYVLLDEMYILIDLKDDYFYLYVKAKKEMDMDKMAHKLLDELLEANAYIEQAHRTKEIRQTILEKALMSNSIDSDDILKQETEMFGDLSADDFYNKK